jgi:hypothetical protein
MRIAAGARGSPTNRRQDHSRICEPRGAGTNWKLRLLTER